jgi:hypothetical protein
MYIARALHDIQLHHTTSYHSAANFGSIWYSIILISELDQLSQHPDSQHLWHVVHCISSMASSSTHIPDTVLLLSEHGRLGDTLATFLTVAGSDDEVLSRDTKAENDTSRRDFNSRLV